MFDFAPSTLKTLIDPDRPMTLSGVPEGFDVTLLAAMARQASANGKALLHIAREDARLVAIVDALSFFAPDVEVVSLPAWDCLPYDRVSPNAEIASRRMATLARLARLPDRIDHPMLVLTTVNAALQRLPNRHWVRQASLGVAVGQQVDVDQLTGFLTTNGYSRSSQVTEPGEFAVRGGLIDIFPTGTEEPIRLDFFGDELDSIRTFDPLTQRTTGKIDRFSARPVAELSLDPDSIRRFRKAYTATFGAVTDDDPLYEAVSDGRRYQGAEHWLPLFHETMETIFDYLPDAPVTGDHQVEEAVRERLDAISDYYQSREAARHADRTALTTPYKPLPPDSLYLHASQWEEVRDARNLLQMTPFQEPQSDQVITFSVKVGRDFGPERNQRDGAIYDALKAHLQDLVKAGKRVMMVSYSAGARDRLIGVLEDHDIRPLDAIERLDQLEGLPKATLAMAVVPLEKGFETDQLAVLTEQDLLGDRLIRKSKRSRKAENFLTEASSLSPGDLVVHVDHGVGRFNGLETITVAGAPHDCVALEYAGGDKLYVPVENIEVLSRYGSEDAGAVLDKLGGQAWQARKAKMKKRIREMAGELIKIAAARELRKGDIISPPDGLYEEFAARFPYSETDDQLRAIEDVKSDFQGGRPMDRLVCGDVGFGKTEVALRAAFLAVMAGHQVAIVAPTTLLARQHHQTFTARFRGLPVRIGQLSRLVSHKDATQTKKNLESGQLDIIIGTHALLGKTIKFHNLGLLIVDEEQHFGVGHKERLKQLKADVHVLTLTATPIPRTLQLAMTGIRDLSLIATPPVDRLAVRTFVMPFDDLVIREALLREHYRGGQSFYVCPRIADLEEAAEFLRDYVPEVRFIIAHGQMAATQIEDTMTAFYEGRYDVLLSTTIVESGLDIPTANTMVIHRADMFGLAQLYQLRGRVGRSKVRAYAYLTYPANRGMTETAKKRLHVLNSLDTLGAGFSVASHDMDIRGAGNLLGEEQSGHIREVGVELYQQMLEEAVAEARSGTIDGDGDKWSPQLNVGATVLIPENYVADHDLRMALYRRLADLDNREDIDAFAAEMIDRFGPLPDEVKQLIAVVTIKAQCRRAGIDKVDAGVKGMTISFRNDRFADPGGLVDFISRQKTTAKLRPDHKLVYLSRMDSVGARLKTVHQVVKGLAKVAQKAQEAA